MTLFNGTYSVNVFIRFAVLASASCLIVGLAKAEPIEVQVWHTLSSVNKAEFEKITKQFNNEQADVKVVLKGFDHQAALRAQATAAMASPGAGKPNLVQIEDNRSPEVIAQHKNIIPLYDLLKLYPIADLNWFLPQTTGFMRDAKGRLLAFPFMAEIPVMFYNLDGYKKAGLDPTKPARTWPELQNQLLALRDKAHYECPFGISQQVNTHLENLAPLNNTLFVTPGNGLDAVKQQPDLNLADAVFMRHMSIMVSWKRSELLTQNSNGTEADALFAKNKCAVVTTTSGALGQMLDTRGLSFGMAPLPFYDQVSPKAGAPFVSGGAFWAVSGHTKPADKATVSFLAYLSKPVIAANWHQRTGYLPLTDAAYRAANVSLYDKVPGIRLLVDSMRQVSDKNSRGFRARNYHSIEPILSRQFDAALSGNTPPVAALTMALDEARPLMQDPSLKKPVANTRSK
jgi:multiple sugar transport system substrate-binding protein